MAYTPMSGFTACNVRHPRDPSITAAFTLCLPMRPGDNDMREGRPMRQTQLARAAHAPGAATILRPAQSPSTVAHIPGVSAKSITASVQGLGVVPLRLNISKFHRTALLVKNLYLLVAPKYDMHQITMSIRGYSITLFTGRVKMASGKELAEHFGNAYLPHTVYRHAIDGPKLGLTISDPAGFVNAPAEGMRKVETINEEGAATSIVLPRRRRRLG